jgi:hypothetical protein
MSFSRVKACGGCASPESISKRENKSRWQEVQRTCRW